MSRLQFTRLTRLRRAGTGARWAELALVVVLGLASVWLTLVPHLWSEDDSTAKVRQDGVHVVAPGTVPRDGPGGAQWAVPEDDLPGGAVPPSVRETTGWDVIARDIVFNLLTAALLLGRRRAPLVCFVAQFVALVVFDFDANPATLVAVMIGAYSLAVHGRSTLVSIGTLLGAGGLAAGFEEDTWPQLPSWAGVFAILLPIGLFGVAIRTARGRAQASEQRAEALEREQQAATQLAVARERARIARELHDVVSHHVSVMTIQAGAAGKVLDAAPELARTALSAIETSGRETMTELRHLLGVLTPGPADDLLHPQPGLEQLDALVANVRAAGQPVTVHGTPATLARGLNLTAYRVVQEALTNALRYAPGAQTDIAISTDDPAGLLIEVINGPPPDARLGPGTGNGTGGSGTGLLGLTERLHLYGGTLATGRLPGGGFSLRARIPLSDPAAPAPLTGAPPAPVDAP